MLRKFGQMLAAAVVFAAGCRDMTMDLLPAPAAAGAGDESAGGMAGDTLMGDAAEGGWGGRAGGGFGGFGGFGAFGAFGAFGGSGLGGSGQCGLGTNCPSCALGTFGCPPCTTNQDCLETAGLQFCSYGRCVPCLTHDCPQGRCGCATDEICSEVLNNYACVPRCGTDDDCRATERPYCDPFGNTCIECFSEKDCIGNPRRTRCYQPSGTCVECFANDECVTDAPICSYLFTCQRCDDPQCGEGKQCQCGEGKQCRDGRCAARAAP